jgi:uncharacterized membrane protein/thiol-disulfide isomerase/thioredoxin
LFMNRPNLFAAERSNVITAATEFLSYLDVQVTKTSIKESIESHPDFPSILSISDAFNKWKVGNICLKVDKQKIDILPVPFIAHLDLGGGTFAVVKSVSKGKISYIKSDKKKEEETPLDDFVKLWDGVALFSERSSESGEKDYVLKRRKEEMKAAGLPFIIICCLILIGAYSLLSYKSLGLFGLTLSLLAIIKFVGCIVTGFLLWYELDQSSLLLNQICSARRHTNCKAVLQSKGAKIFGLITWGEIGFIYFSGSFLSLLFSAQSLAVPILAWLNLASLIFIPYAIIYQWRIAKQWCPLCLAVHALLIAELALFYFQFWDQPLYHYALNLSSVGLPLAAAFLVPILFWIFSKNKIYNSFSLDKYKNELNRLKHNTIIFDTLLEKETLIAREPKGLGITLGNPEASQCIIKVCNPYCGPCAKAHPVIDELLDENPNVKVQIIFAATDDEKDKRSKPVKHFLALSEMGDTEKLKRALDDWYLADKKDYDAFAAKYPMNGELELQNEKIRNMSDWCVELKIKGTPTFFVNGRPLPSMYDVNDLKSLMR